MRFTDFRLNSKLLEAISYMDFTKATPIQEKAIPIILENKDLIACAQTGTGKTIAFVLPVLNKILDQEDSKTKALIIVPTRELAIQIEQQIQGLSYFISVGSKAVYGGGSGKDWDLQKEALTKGTDIIVATPGKLLSHLMLGYVDFQNVTCLVLDEADRMLNMGFIEDLYKIISYIPKKRQTLMFSATMPTAINKLAKKISHQPEEISLSLSKPAEGINQKVVLTSEQEKLCILNDLLKKRREYDSILVFTSLKRKVNQIVKTLIKYGFNAQGISSNLNQNEREEVLRAFRSKRIRILVATDVMSRGIDIQDINLVINYDIPHDAEDYVHRVGRTARANTKGEAFTFVIHSEKRKLREIEQLIESKIPRL